MHDEIIRRKTASFFRRILAQNMSLRERACIRRYIRHCQIWYRNPTSGNEGFMGVPYSPPSILTCGLMNCTDNTRRPCQLTNYAYYSLIYSCLRALTSMSLSIITRIWHVHAKHANRMDARAHSSTLAECAPRFMTPRSQGFVGQSSPNLAHV